MNTEEDNVFRLDYDKNKEKGGIPEKIKDIIDGQGEGAEVVIEVRYGGKVLKIATFNVKNLTSDSVQQIVAEVEKKRERRV